MRKDEEQLLKLRPEILNLDQTGVYDKSVEQFQNICLRPIIKYQHDIIYTILQAEKNLKAQLKHQDLSDQACFMAIKNYINKSGQLQFLIIGLIRGLLTIDENSYYQNHAHECNKRIINIVAERIMDFAQKGAF